MKGISKKASAKLIALFNATDENGGHLKIDQTNGNFMPLVVEKTGSNAIYDFYSTAHYYKQKGDMLRDPEVTYAVHRELRSTKNAWIGSLSYEQDGMFFSTYEHLIFNEEGNICRWKPKCFRDTNSFVTQWMDNVFRQQRISVRDGKIYDRINKMYLTDNQQINSSVS